MKLHPAPIGHSPVGRWKKVKHAVREVKEETGLDVKVVGLLFEEEYEFGTSYCYLAELTDANTELTLDFLPREESMFGTMLRFAEWHSIKDKKDDMQVSKVISTLGLNYG